MASLKSHTAFKFNVESLFDLSQSGVYFWSSTSQNVLTVKQASKRWSGFAKDMVLELRVYELHDEHGLHIHWLVDRFLPVQIVRRIAQRHGFGRIHVMRVGKDIGEYLAKYLSKSVRAECLKGKRLWAAFGNVPWTRVKDIQVQSWLGTEYRRLRGHDEGLSRGQSYGILQDAMLNYARWVERASGIEVWVPAPAPLPVSTEGIPF